MYGGFSVRVKLPEGEAYNLSPSDDEVKYAWSYISSPFCVFMA
jgi:hypothetical protein